MIISYNQLYSEEPCGSKQHFTAITTFSILSVDSGYLPIMKKSFPLYVNILSIFTLLTCIIVISVVSYGYIRNSDIAIFSAQQLLRQTGSSIGERTQNIFDTAFTTVNTYVSFPDIGKKATIHSHPMSSVFFNILKHNQDFTSVYIGFADGDFYLVSSLRNREQMKKEKGIPSSAVWYTQTIGHRADGTRYELTKYLDSGMVTIGSSSTINVQYDPRKRNWFKDATKTDIAMLSDIYVFAMSGEPGLTVSRRFDSNMPGVVGVDMSLANLSNFMKKQLLGDKCEIMIFGNSGELYGYHNLEKLTAGMRLNKNLTFSAANVSSLNNPVLNSMFNGFQKEKSDKLQLQLLPLDGTPYISLIDPLPKEYGKELFIAIAVPESFFTGPIASIGRQTLLVSIAMLTLFLPVIFLAAKRLSKPLNELTQGVKNIQEFKLDIPVMVKSSIIEIHDLSRATETMRGTLNAFGSYIPRPLVESMIVNSITPKLGGKRKELTFMFSDIKDFTSISESLSPEHLTRSITKYFKFMSRVVLDNGGTIDKYIGDAIMAFWNAPADDINHARNACLTALQCMERVNTFNELCRQNNEPEMLTRIGVHTGEAIVGNVGSSDRMDYTAMGAAVNMASRLEGLNKYFGTEILVSETTMQAAGKDFQFRFAGKVIPKGTSIGVGVYELLGTVNGSTGTYAPFAVPPEETSRVADWEKAFAILLSCDFTAAAAAFSAYLKQHGPDSLSEYYLALAEKYITQPPSESWHGEVIFDVK